MKKFCTSLPSLNIAVPHIPSVVEVSDLRVKPEGRLHEDAMKLIAGYIKNPGNLNSLHKNKSPFVETNRLRL